MPPLTNADTHAFDTSHNDESKASSRMKSSQSSNETSGLKPQRVSKVRFGTVQIREYNIAIADNPCVRGGPPIGLGWRGKVVGECKLDDYEGNRQIRRTGHELVIPRGTREEILIHCGYARRDIVEAIRMVNKIRNQRVQTVNNLAMSGLEETMESLRKLFFGSCLTKKVAEPALYSFSDFDGDS